VIVLVRLVVVFLIFVVRLLVDFYMLLILFVSGVV